MGKKSVEQLQGEDKYRRMIEEVEDYAIILLDQNGIVQSWNRGAQKIKQYKAEEIIGLHFSMFYLPEDRMGKLPDILLNQAVTHGRAIHEGWRMRKDRTKFWGSITLTALHGDNGEVIGFSKVTRDLTDKKLAEDQLRTFTAELQLSNEALRKSEERYHRMIAEVQEYAIILLDVDGNIRNWNIGAEKIKGYTAEEILGKNFQIFYREEDRERKMPQLLLREAAESGRAIHEGWRKRKDGSLFWGSIVITSLHDEMGNIIGYSKVTRDLTEKKQTEEKLNEYLKELERRNEELSRFAYAASHDLQEPLRKVQTFADLIEQNLNDKDAVSRYIQKIITSTERMVALVKSILEYSRLPRKAVQLGNVDLNQILSEVIGDFELLIHERKATINAAQLPLIEGDAQQITQLFSNLISNALKFASNEPRITIASTKISSSEIHHFPIQIPHGDYWQVMVSDNGIGFDQQYSDRIFSLFQRLQNKHEYDGSGIGLALCKKVMDNHNGFIRGESRPGEGASFYAYFPAERAS